ncbi:hypothetical protein EV363DRAFT_1299824 [Boletus edulis]|nr:hypothetical protein EV363DRAFT_1299824 [Boletus edulis]
MPTPFRLGPGGLLDLLGAKGLAQSSASFKTLQVKTAAGLRDLRALTWCVGGTCRTIVILDLETHRGPTDARQQVPDEEKKVDFCALITGKLAVVAIDAFGNWSRSCHTIICGVYVGFPTASSSITSARTTGIDVPCIVYDHRHRIADLDGDVESADLKRSVPSMLDHARLGGQAERVHDNDVPVARQGRTQLRPQPSRQIRHGNDSTSAVTHYQTSKDDTIGYSSRAQVPRAKPEPLSNFVCRKRRPNRAMTTASTSKKRYDNEDEISSVLSSQSKPQLGPVH